MLNAWSRDESLLFASYIRSIVCCLRQRSNLSWSHSQLGYGCSELIGRPSYFTRQLPSVLNAAQRLIYNLKRSDHVADALISLRWLWVSESIKNIVEGIKNKVAVLTHQVLHKSAPRYLGTSNRIDDRHGRQELCSAVINHMLVSSFSLSTVISRTFPVADPLIWNNLKGHLLCCGQRFASNWNMPFPLSYPDSQCNASIDSFLYLSLQSSCISFRLSRLLHCLLHWK